MLLSMLLIAVAASIAQAQNLASSKPINVQVAALWDPETVESAAKWAAAHEKGDRLVCRLEANDEAAGRLWSDTRNPPSACSQWGDAALRIELPLWGWFIGEFDQEFHCHFSDDDADGHINKIGTAFEALGLNPKPRSYGGDNVCFNIEHYDESAEDDDGDILEAEDQYYKVNGQTYRCTGAHVRFGINQPGGMIIGLDFQSPRVKALENWGHANAAELPQLQRVSDIMMAFWLRDNPNPKNLKYYLVYNIKNELTVSLINTVLRNHNLDQVPYWPGIVANMWEEEGPTLLGSPLDGSLAFLLAQHKAELGVKHVTEVVIFRDNFPQNVEPTLQLLFKIKDVPDPAPDAESGQALRIRGSVLDDELRNKVRIHKIFQDTRAVIVGSA